MDEKIPLDIMEKIKDFIIKQKSGNVEININCGRIVSFKCVEYLKIR